MSLSRDSRTEQKLKAALLAQKRLEQRFEMIDWREDTYLPLLEAYKSGKSVFGLEAGKAFTIELVHEDPNSPKPDDSK